MELARCANDNCRSPADPQDGRGLCAPCADARRKDVQDFFVPFLAEVLPVEDWEGNLVAGKPLGEAVAEHLERKLEGRRTNGPNSTPNGAEGRS